MVVYGSGIADGNRHTHHDLPVLLAGAGGGTLKPGRHMRFPTETPMNNLYLALLERHGRAYGNVGRRQREVGASERYLVARRRRKAGAAANRW